MIALHPNILEKNGKREFAVLPYDEFVRVSEELEDYEDLKALRQAKHEESDAPVISFDVAKAMLLPDRKRSSPRKTKRQATL